MANNKIRLSTQAKGSLPVAQGGTGVGSYTDGQLLIGNSSTGQLTPATLTSAGDIQITNTAGGVEIGMTESQPLPLNIMGGRISLTTEPVMSSNIPGASGTTIYYVPYTGVTVSLLYFDQWKMFSIPTNPVLSLSLATFQANFVYDIYLYAFDATTVRLDFQRWANGSQRSIIVDGGPEDLVYLDGVLVKLSDPSRRYVGTIYMSTIGGQCVYRPSATNTERPVLSVYNHYNKVPTTAVKEGVSSSTWNYTTPAWRYVLNSSQNSVQILNGWDASAFSYSSVQYSTTQLRAHIGVRRDNTTTPGFDSFSYDFNVTGMANQKQVLKATGGLYGLNASVGISGVSMYELGSTGVTGYSGSPVAGGGNPTGIISIVTM